MRKISLTPYPIPGGDYDVRTSLAGILFIPQLRLAARDAIEHDRIARTIEGAGDEVLLEEAEYARVRMAVEAYEGYSREDLELVRRVLEAPAVAVTEKTQE